MRAFCRALSSLSGQQLVDSTNVSCGVFKSSPAANELIEQHLSQAGESIFIGF